MIDKLIPTKIPNCLVTNSEDSTPVFDTYSFNLEDRYNFQGLDDNIGVVKRSTRVSTGNPMKPNDDAPEFRG